MRAAALFLTTAFIAMTAACSSGEAEKNADGSMSKSAIAAEMAEAGTAQPGQYESTMQILLFEVPGMPPEALAQMRQQMEGAMAVQNRYCLSAEDARSGRQDMMKRLANADGNCSFQKFDVSGDAVEAQMSCSGQPGGGSMTMAMEGTMASTASDITINAQMRNPAVPQANATMRFRVTSRRTGDCTEGAN